MTEAMTVNSPSHEEDFDDVGCNADLYLYASRQDAFQGSSRGRGSYERSQQQNDPHCFQSLSLDYVLEAQYNGEIVFMECS